jgi:enolase 1/2/3
VTDCRIEAVDAWEVLDSRGNPTVAAAVRLHGGAVGTCAVPSGASTGAHEAPELRDGEFRYAGKGVLHAVHNVRTTLADLVRGIDAADQSAVDNALRSLDIAEVGANAVLAVSVASALAAATAHGQQLYEWVPGESVLPLPMVNILSGGAHAGRCLDIQDVLVIPLRAGTFAEAIEQVAAVRRQATEMAVRQQLSAGQVADEGGLGLPLGSNEAAFDFVTDAITHAGFEPGRDLALAVDIAASQFYESGEYRLRIEGRVLDRAAWLTEVERWVGNHPIVSVEDACAEDEWDAWTELTARIGDRVQLLGDDFFVTNSTRLQRGIDEHAANSILVKPNQIGTLSDALSVVQQAHKHGIATVVSARSGETEDAWIADLATGWGAGQLKVGSTTRSERTAKWNRLLQIEHAAGLRYAGAAALQVPA